VSGYVAAHRTIIGHPAFRNDSEAMAFVWMILKAQWKDVRVRYKERGIHLKRGQLAVSQRDMARSLDRDKAWIERLWKRLKSEAMIEVATEAGVAVITICNYGKYQNLKGMREAVPEAGCEAEVRQGRGTEQEREEREEEENTPSGVSPPTAPKMPLKAAADCWNEAAGRAGWKTILTLTGNREEQLRNRLREVGLDGWKAAIGQALSSDYLAGSDPPNWFTFDFIIKATNFSKLREGNYDRSRTTAAEAPSPTRLAVERAIAAANAGR